MGSQWEAGLRKVMTTKPGKSVSNYRKENKREEKREEKTE